MNQPSVEAILTYARRSQFIARRALIRGGIMVQKKDRDLPLLLYTERKSVEGMYAEDPDSAITRKAANYLLSLCGAYGLEAMQDGNGQGQVVDGTGTTNNTDMFPIHITQADFESDGISYNDPRIVGKNLALFMNDVSQKYIYAPTGFTYTATGIVMNTGPGADIPDFDASVNNYDILIYKIYT